MILWEAHMFLCMLFTMKPKGELIFIDTFVYALGEDKRDLVQKLDCIS